MIGLRDVCGLWRRTLIAWPDGRTDAETEVFWLQGPRHYADLRVPAGRPPCAGCHLPARSGLAHAALHGAPGRFLRTPRYRCFGRCMAPRLRLSAGHRHRGSRRARLRRRHPRSSVASICPMSSIGRANPAPATCWRSRWPPKARPRPDVLSWRTTRSSMRAGASMPLPPRRKSEPNWSTARLRCKRRKTCSIARFRSDAATAAHWRIERSSHCFREGAVLSPALDGAGGSLVIDDVTRRRRAVQAGVAHRRSRKLDRCAAVALVRIA